MEQAQIPPVDLVEELARRESQLEQIRTAYIELQQNQGRDNHTMQNLTKTINYLPTFTGTGDVTVNSFFSSTEYLLSTIDSDVIRREAVRMIFYKTIQGQAKDVIINLPTPDNWQLIKETLKLRYRPSIEPHQIYKLVANLKVNSVSELIVEIQNIKYKSDELSVYYKGEHYIDLSNVDSLLVNTVKEMTQGTLLDKIYEETNINDILKILTRRRFEDTCIRPEYRKFRERTNYRQWPNSTGQRVNQNVNQNQRNYDRFNNGQNYQRHNPQFHQEKNNNFNNNFNNSGRYRAQNNRDDNMSGQFRNLAQVGNPRPNSGQYRWNQPRQDRVEKMEVDNIERIYNNPQVAGHPNHKFSQNRLNSDRQSTEGPEINYGEEINNTVFFMKQPLNACQR